MGNYVIIISILINWTALGVQAKVYDNDTYRFDVTLPDDKTICTPPAPAPAHGFSLLLDSSDCEQVESVARISLFVAYNVAEEATSSRDLAHKDCDHGVGVRTNIVVDGMRFYRCTHVSKDKSAEYVALRSDIDEWAVFIVTLYDPKGKYKASLIRDLLSGMHLHKNYRK